MKRENCDYDEMLRLMDEKLKRMEKLRKEDPEEAKRIAIMELQASGILDENGELKAPYNGVSVHSTDFTMGPRDNIEYEETDLEVLIERAVLDTDRFYKTICEELTPQERLFIRNQIAKSCTTCTNQSCRIETFDKVGLDENGKPQGCECVGWNNDRLIGEYKVLKLNRIKK